MDQSIITYKEGQILYTSPVPPHTFCGPFRRAYIHISFSTPLQNLINYSYT